MAIVKVETIQREAERLVPLLTKWVLEGEALRGTTLPAILANDLAGANSATTEPLRWLVPAILDWLSNAAPAECWGSAADVVRWADTYEDVTEAPGDRLEHPNMRRTRVLRDHPVSATALREDLQERFERRTAEWPV